MKKVTLYYLLVIIAFAAISVFYFSPDVFEGKTLYQGDITTGYANGREISNFKKETGEETLWTNVLFGGMPTYQIYVNHSSSSFLNTVQKVLYLQIPYPANILFVMLLGAFLLFLAIGTDIRIAAIGAIAYTFSSYFLIIIHAGHIWKVMALAYIPPTFAGIIWTYKQRYLLGGIVTAIFTGLQLLANHVQMTYYFGLLLFIYLVFEFIYSYKNKLLLHFVKASAVLLLAGGLALSLNATNLFHTYQYSKLTMRGPSELVDTTGQQSKGGLDRDYATQWSYGIGETFTLLVPDLKGGSSKAIDDKDALEKVDPRMRGDVAQSSRYWGNQPFTEGPVYVGAFIMFLFVLGLFIVKHRMKWVLLAGTILSFLLAWGHNFMWFTNLFMDYVPLYNKFRTVSSILVIAELTIPMLAGLALMEILKNPEVVVENKKGLYIALGSTIGVILILIIVPSLFSYFSANEMKWFSDAAKNPNQAQAVQLYTKGLEAARIHIMRSDAFRSLLIIVVGLVLLYFFVKKKMNSTVFLVSVGLLTLFDLTLVDKRYLNSDDFHVRQTIGKNIFPESSADREILKDTSYYRVFNRTVSTFQDASTSWRHFSIGGYHAAKLRRYQDLIDHHISEKNFNMRVLNMLNAKYFIVKVGDSPKAVQNYEALGNAWFADSIILAENPNMELAMLNNFNPSTTAVMDTKFTDIVPSKYNKTGTDSTAKITLTQYQPNCLKYESNSQEDKLGVFSEIYYPHGWHAYIDGKEVEYARVNYVLRALPIPAGKHLIEFRFDPISYRVTEKIGYTASILLIIAMLAVIFIEVQRQRSQKAIENIEK